MSQLTMFVLKFKTRNKLSVTKIQKFKNCAKKKNSNFHTTTCLNLILN